MYDSILIPTDGSEGAEDAAHHGMRLANAFDATVHIVSVVDVRSYNTDLADIDRIVRQHREALEERAQEAVTTLEELATKHEVAYESGIEHGIPNELILSYASNHNIDLIVMGTHGRTGLDRFLLGSVTERVVRTSEIPALAARSGTASTENGDYETLLIPTDGSSAAAAAVNHGLTIAAKSEAAVHVLYVIRTERGLPDISDPSRAEAEEAVESVAEQASARGIDVTTHVQSGTPYNQIRNFVTKQGIDLVSMGTHGRSGLRRLFLGSVTEKVIRTCDAPVLTVRPPETE